MIPVDDVARGLATICAAATIGRAGGVFQLASSDVNPLTFGRTVELTGLAMRRWTRKGGGRAIDQVYRHLDPIPVTDPGRFAVPKLRSAVADLLDVLPDDDAVPGWLDRLTDAKRWRDRARERLADTDKQLKRVEAMLALYKPCIEDHDYCFRTDRVRALQQPGAFACDLASLDWRHYWVDVEYPGLRTWCMPVLDGEKPPRDPASIPPLRITSDVSLRAAS